MVLLNYLSSIHLYVVSMGSSLLLQENRNHAN